MTNVGCMLSPDQDHVLSLADLEAGANTTFTDCAQHKYHYLVKGTWGKF